MEGTDFLYQIFEKHLFQTVRDEVSTDDFCRIVVEDYILRLARQGVSVPIQLRPVLELDLFEEVLEMTRKKTYGCVSVLEFRMKNASVIEQFLRRPI